MFVTRIILNRIRMNDHNNHPRYHCTWWDDTAWSFWWTGIESYLKKSLFGWPPYWSSIEQRNEKIWISNHINVRTANWDHGCKWEFHSKTDTNRHSTVLVCFKLKKWNWFITSGRIEWISDTIIRYHCREYFISCQVQFAKARPYLQH